MSTTQFQVPFISQHSWICASLVISFPRTVDAEFVRNFLHADLNGIKQHIMQTDFCEMFLTKTNRKLRFLNKLFSALINYVPIKRVVNSFNNNAGTTFPNSTNYYRS